MFRRTVLSFALVVGLLPACDDPGKRSQEVASEGLGIVMPLIERDVAQVRSGVPEGVKVLAQKAPADPAGSRLELQAAIKAARGSTQDLVVAKVTFFAFANVDGVVLRNETDPDRLVDQNVLQALPGLAKAKDPKAGLAEAFGEMEAIRGVKRGSDLAWVVAHGVPGEGDGARGILVTGWSMRLYVRTLEQQLVAKLTEQVKAKGSGAVPVAYVFLVKGGVAYSDPDRADTISDEIAKLDLVAKSAGGETRLQLDIEKRVFGVAAKRVPAFGDDAALVIAVSVF